jgi:hypothetical protein
MSTTPNGPLARLERIVPWLGGLALALPVLIVRYPPMADLPLHEASVGLLRHWGDPHFAPPSIYFVNLGQSNQLFSILVYLFSWVVPIGWASKIVVAATVVALPVAATHFADHVGAPRWTALLVAPINLGWLFFWGLIQNMIGLVALIALMPAIDRFAAKPAPRSALALCGAMILFHFAHQAMQLVALLALVVCTVGSPIGGLRGAALRLVPAAFCAVIVAAAMASTWRFAGRLHYDTPLYRWAPLLYKVEEMPGVLFAGYETYVRDLMMLLVSLPVVLFFVERLRLRAGAARTWAERAREWRFELLALILFVLYLAAPLSMKSTTLVYHRFLPPAWAIFAVSAASHTARVARLLPRALCATAPLASLLTSWPVFVDADQMYSDLDVLLPKIEPGSAVIALSVGPDTGVRLWNPMVAEGHVVAVKGGRSLIDYTDSPNSPVSQRPTKIWAEPLRRMEGRPFRFRPAWDFTRYRYLLLTTPKPSRAAGLTLAMRNEATLIGAQGDWYLFESKLPLVPIDADDAPLPTPRPPTLRALAHDVLSQARDVIESESGGATGEESP